MLRVYPPFVPPAPLGNKPACEWSRQEAGEYFEWLAAVAPERIGYLWRLLRLADIARPSAFLAEAGNRAAAYLKQPAFSRLGTKHHDSTLALATRFAPGQRLQAFPPIPKHAPELTDEGYALAADMGLLVARLILEHAPVGSVRWEILRRPDRGSREASWLPDRIFKSEPAYNLPVLTAQSVRYFEPLGASISQAYGILHGDRQPDIWARMYDHYLAELLSPGQPS